MRALWHRLHDLRRAAYERGLIDERPVETLTIGQIRSRVALLRARMVELRLIGRAGGDA